MSNTWTANIIAFLIVLKAIKAYRVELYFKSKFLDQLYFDQIVALLKYVIVILSAD